ncbi:MAG: flavodoxin family protein [Paludibacteraceae bacterium]|nr:flavodoxin family protein [Paludibacteraceae bacterium]
MKVLLINGSPHKEGNTYIALNEAAQQLNKRGVETEIIWVGNQPIRGCVVCGTCKHNDNRCIFNDDPCNMVISAMEHCDGLIIGAPVYYGQPAAQAMALQQRMLYAGSAAFMNKSAAAVCVCRRGGATAAFQSLQMPFQMCNMPIVTSQYWNIVYGRDAGEAKLDVEGMQTMRTLADNMAYLLSQMASGTASLPERETKQVMGFIRYDR